MNIMGRWIFVFFVGIYLLTLKGAVGNFHPKDYGITRPENQPPFETSMERGRFAQTVALFENRSFAVDSFYSFLKPDLAWYKGRYLPAFPPAVSLLAVPLYAVGKLINANQLFTAALSSIAGLFTMYVLVKIGRWLKLSQTAILFMCLAFGFGTSAWAYGVSVSAHLVSALTFALSLYLCLIKKEKSIHLFFLGLVYAASILVDFPNAVILLPFIIWAAIRVIRSRNVIGAILGIAGAAGLLIPYSIFSQHYYDRYFAFTNTINLKRIAAYPINYDQPEQNTFLNQHYAKNFSLSRVAFGMNVLLFSSDRGLVNYSPVYLLILPGMYWLYKKDRRAAILISGGFLAQLLVYSAFEDPWGGWGFGPRYLIPAMPGLAVAVGLAFEKIQNKVRLKGLAIVLLVVSMGINLAGALTTNAVPPSVEARHSKMKSNYMYNIDKLAGGMTSSFFYNSAVPKALSPIGYFYTVWFVTALIPGYLIYLNKS